MKVTIADYGIGNLHSVLKAMRAAGADVTVSDDPAVVRAADRVVLPGVGAFGDGMAAVNRLGLADALRDVARAGRPFLGICLGMQMLFTDSEEFGHHAGLDLLPGRVLAIAGGAGVKVPHIGWNRIAPPAGGPGWDGTLLAGVAHGAMVYFVHSFTAHPSREQDRLADADYHGRRLSAGVQRDNLMGCQFHPEKSGELGLSLVRRFVSI